MADLVGKNVVLFGLRREDLNGEVGRVLRYDKKEDRCAVKVESSGKTFKVHPDNLEEDCSDEDDSDYQSSDSDFDEDSDDSTELPPPARAPLVQPTGGPAKSSRIPAPPSNPAAAAAAALKPPVAATAPAAAAATKAASGVFGMTSTHGPPLAHGFAAEVIQPCIALFVDALQIALSRPRQSKSTLILDALVSAALFLDGLFLDARFLDRTILGRAILGPHHCSEPRASTTRGNPVKKREDHHRQKKKNTHHNTTIRMEPL